MGVAKVSPKQLGISTGFRPRHKSLNTTLDMALLNSRKNRGDGWAQFLNFAQFSVLYFTCYVSSPLSEDGWLALKGDTNEFAQNIYHDCVALSAVPCGTRKTGGTE